jgi:hypothetical protein
MSRTSKSGKQGGIDGLTTLTRQFAQLKQQTKAIGIFTDDRELLKSPNCGLLEDVMAEGVLVTYPRDSADLKDCGLRFKQVGETSLACPACGIRIKVVIS